MSFTATLCHGEHFHKCILDYMNSQERININFEERFAICKDLINFFDINCQPHTTRNNWLNIQTQDTNNLHKSLAKLITTFYENKINVLNSFVQKFDMYLHGKVKHLQPLPNDD